MINSMSADEIVAEILKGNRAILARAMTIIESTHPKHHKLAGEILDKIMPLVGKAKRIGITGVPGAGKSTLLEALGMYLVNSGLKVAIIAIDPSSSISGGSILADKTRMTTLLREYNAFIRPVPSGGHLGGTSRRTRELTFLLDAAGFDVVFIDPPFAMALAVQTCQWLEEKGWLSKHAKIYVETESTLKLDGLPENWQLLKSKVAGEVGYHLFERSG